MDRASLHLLFVQRWRCPICRGLLLHGDRPPQGPHEWEQWLAATRKAIAKSYLTMREDGTPDENKLRLVHAQCQSRHVGDGTGTALLPASDHRPQRRFDPPGRARRNAPVIGSLLWNCSVMNG